jgi:hypothetical protein
VTLEKMLTLRCAATRCPAACGAFLRFIHYPGNVES